MAMTNGLGVFLAAGDMVQMPVDTAEKALACGATWAPVLVQSVEGTQQPTSRVALVCASLRSADIDPVLYIFPTPSTADKAIKHLADCVAATGIIKLCLDIEPFRGEDWNAAQIKSLVLAARAIRPDVQISITLFTRRQWNRIDWEQAAPGVEIWLQVYDRAKDADELKAACAPWALHTLVLIFGTYVGDLARLDHDLSNVTPYAKQVGTAALWALRTTDAHEAAHIKGWALHTWAPPAPTP